MIQNFLNKVREFHSRKGRDRWKEEKKIRLENYFGLKPVTTLKYLQIFYSTCYEILIFIRPNGNIEETVYMNLDLEK